MSATILDGITRDDVLQAIRDFVTGGVTHGFIDSTKYDLLFDGNRYPPKAILGIAGRRSNGRILLPSDFKGGLDSKCFRVLESLGFDVVQKASTTERDEWSDEELDAAVEAYLEMLDLEVSGKPFNKASENRNLREGPLSGRGRGSIEYRMQNISYVLNRRGERWISGYKPAANVGANTESRIVTAIGRTRAGRMVESAPEVAGKGLEAKVRKLRKRGVKSKPEGRGTPEKTTVTSEQYKRDPQVKAWVLEAAAGVCELCSNPAPFRDTEGFPFLEVHHVKYLAHKGSDTISNAVALCPNCHRLCHYSPHRPEAIERLYRQLTRLVRE